jgi:CBS-domain-containing membrane protein
MDVMAVGLAIMMMHLLRCLHPPGGLSLSVAIARNLGLGLEFLAIPRRGKLLDAFSYRLVIQQYDWKQIPASS